MKEKECASSGGRKLLSFVYTINMLPCNNQRIYLIASFAYVYRKMMNTFFKFIQKKNRKIVFVKKKKENEEKQFKKLLFKKLNQGSLIKTSL